MCELGSRRRKPGMLLIGVMICTVMLGGRMALADQQTSDVMSSVNVEIELETGNEFPSTQEYFINLDDCRDLVVDPPEVTITWNFDRDPPSDAQYTVKIQKNDETCALSSLTTETTDDCITLEQQVSFSSQTIQERFDFDEIVSDMTSRADCDSAEGDTYDVALIFTEFIVSGDDTEDDTDLDEIRFQFVTQRPSAPTGVVVEAGESSIDVDWNEVSNAVRYYVYYSTTEFVPGSDPSEIDAQDETTTSDDLRITDNIQRNATYYIAVTSEDDYGNESLLSQVVTITTQPVTDFFEYYRQQGGTETGGYCRVAEGVSTWGLGVMGMFVGLVLLARRRR